MKKPCHSSRNGSVGKLHCSTLAFPTRKSPPTRSFMFGPFILPHHFWEVAPSTWKTTWLKPTGTLDTSAVVALSQQGTSSLSPSNRPFQMSPGLGQNNGRVVQKQPGETLFPGGSGGSVFYEGTTAGKRVGYREHITGPGRGATRKHMSIQYIWMYIFTYIHATYSIVKWL